LHQSRIDNSPHRFSILYIITRGDLGGAQTHVFDLVQQLARQGFEVHVAMGNRGPLWEQLAETRVSVHHIPALVRPISATYDIRALRQTVALIRKIKPALITTHSSKAGMLGRMAARRCRIPVIFTAHGWAFTEGVPAGRRRFYVLAERAAARWTDRIICVSEYDRQLALKYGVGRKEQLVTIHNGIPELSEDHMAEPEEGNPVRLIMVARFSEPKNQRLLIKAIDNLECSNDFEVCLVGDGPLLESCRELAAERGLLDKVKFLGARKDIPELLSRAHIFVLTSNWEGFPITILEAMRAGLPVIASDVGGVGEAVVDGKTGFLIPRGDIEVLKDRLTRLIDNPGLRVELGQAGRQRFTENFTIDIMLAKTVSVYQQILQQRECG
jgi:glycosyltransferase involved in cell wall biosynthesis